MLPPKQPTYSHLPLRKLTPSQLDALSQERKLALDRTDMLAIQQLYREWQREPTDLELEAIAQTWSEHCKHRILAATVHYKKNGQEETIHSLFETYIKAPTERIMAEKSGFVLSAFHDNAGFIKIDNQLAACLKVETHNHPTAIHPYHGASTGLGGVIRDILGAGKGAKPIASLDVLCFGSLNTPEHEIKAPDVIPPHKIMEGVVTGISDYGNRMGIPTALGAVQFDSAYTYNPLVFCGTAGVIPRQDIDKKMKPGFLLFVAGGRTGREGLKGATFSSATLTGESHAQDHTAIQTGNPIEEKKLLDFILLARAQGLIEFITDCGAGGLSSAAGEMLSHTGGEIFLERVPLKHRDMASWEIFLSESQERMVFAAQEEHLPSLQEIAVTTQTEITPIGHSDDSHLLRVWHHSHLVAELDNARLHRAPTKQLYANYIAPTYHETALPQNFDLEQTLLHLLSDLAICSRESIIRQYDHEVQGNTLIKPFGGRNGRVPQDGAVIAIDNSQKSLAFSCSLLPEWGKVDPYQMGLACIDECVRQLIAMGADPAQIALLDNFCAGDPEQPEILGSLVECIKGIAHAAETYQTPFISGKDSFYNTFETQEGPVHIPLTFLASGLGVIQNPQHITGSSLRSSRSTLYLLGETTGKLGGSVFARCHHLTRNTLPETDCPANLRLYQKLHHAIKSGLILSAHDLSEGGLAIALAEMAFSEVAGLDITLPNNLAHLSLAEQLFSEDTGRLLLEIPKQHTQALESHFAGEPLVSIATSTTKHRHLKITQQGQTLFNIPIAKLHEVWANSLTCETPQPSIPA